MTTSTANGLTAVVVEDDLFFREVIIQSLRGLISDCRVLPYANGQDAKDELYGDAASIGLVLIDLNLPDCDGISVIEHCRVQFPAAPIMVISSVTDESRVLHAISKGANGFLTKGDSSLSITQAIKEVLGGGHPISPGLAGFLFKLVTTTAPTGTEAIDLTEKEREVLANLARGFSYREIAEAMSISLSTVQSHVRNLYRKLGVNTRLHAFQKAKATGLLT